MGGIVSKPLIITMVEEDSHSDLHGWGSDNSDDEGIDGRLFEPQNQQEFYATCGYRQRMNWTMSAWNGRFERSENPQDADWADWGGKDF